MKKEIKSIQAPISKRLMSMTLDLIVLILSTTILYFIGFYSFIQPLTDYNANQITVTEMNKDNNLDIKDDGYEQYLSAIQSFYYRHEPEIVRLYSVRYERSLTIEHIYNINILDLPVDPTMENYKGDYFQYQQKENGLPDVNKLGMVVSGKNSDKFLADLHIIVEGKYERLPTLLASIDKTYHGAVQNNLRMESFLRLGAITFSVLIFYLIIPMCNKSGDTIFEKQYRFAQVNSQNGYRIGYLKRIFRPIVAWFLPVLFITLSISAKIIVVACIPIFINYLCLIFTKTNRTLEQIITFTDTVNEDESLMFLNKDEEIAYENSDEYKQLEDPDYLNRLQSIEKFNLGDSRADELNKNQEDKIDNKTDSSDKEESN